MTQLSFDHQLTFGAGRPRRRGRWLFYMLALPAVGYGLAYTLSEEVRLMVAAPEMVSPSPMTEAPVAAVAPAPEPPPVKKIDIAYVVRPSDTLGQIFQRLNLDASELPALLDVPAVRDSFTLLKPGERLTFALRNDVLHGLDRRIGETQVLSIRRGAHGFAAQVVETPIEIKTVQVRGTINSSLFFNGRAVGLPPEMAQQVATEIFGWDIDFARDIRPGDRFKIIYEEKYRDGEYLGDGRIVVAELINDGVVHRAVRYTSPDGAVDGYFTPEGRSVRRPILRAPIDFTRVSPKVGPADRQTLLHTLREHQGLDYPAPAGTVVKAAGEGRIKFAGVIGEYGNTVVIEHGGKISTLYAHLSAFARDLHANQQVKQGDIIGLVGHSGAATAPHLHYEYRVDGTPTDPRTAELPAGARIPDKYLADFQSKAGALLAALEQPADVVVTALHTE